MRAAVIWAGLLMPGLGLGQTTVWMRDGIPGAVKRITGAVDGPSGTIRLTINGHGFSSGDKINVDGVGGCYRASGTRTVSAVVDANTIDIIGRDGTTLLDCGGTYRHAVTSGTVGARYYTAAKLTPYILNDPPNIYGLDGPSGTLTLALQTRTKVGNPAYEAMKTIADAALGSGGNSYTGSTTPANRGAVFSAAMMWHAHGRSTCSGGTITTRANGSKFCTTDATWEYLDMARWWINHAEGILRGPGCDESVVNCGRSGYQNSIDQNSPELTSYPMAYSIVYDQLTSDERTAFSNKMLNNVKMNHSSETGCSNQYVEQTGSTLTGTAGNKFVTITPAAAAGAATIGDQIRWNAPTSTSPISDRLYTVTAIDTGSGRIDLNTAIGESSPNATSWYTVAPWALGDCGFVWFEGHFDINALWTRDAYPPTGGNAYSWMSNLTWWRLDAYVSIGATTCPFDVRGCELFERAQAFYYDQMSNHAKNLWSGFTQAGSGSYQGRVQGNAAMTAATLKGALTPPLDTSEGVWLKRTLLRQIYDNLPGAAHGTHFHSWGETAQRSINAYGLNHVQYLVGAVGTTDEADRARHWLFNRFQFTKADLQFGGGIFAPWSFMNIDPGAPRSDYTALSPQYLFQQTDLDTPPQNYLGAYSKTGWGDSDTSILMLVGGSWEDHWQWRSPGTYQIFKGNYLYADDRGTSIGSCGSSVSCFSQENAHSSSILIGEPSSATATQQVTWADSKFDPIGPVQGTYIEMKRWSGTNPTGRSDNKFTYLAYDAYRAASTSTIGTTVNRAWHHYLHLKANGRDYLLRYADIGLAAPRRMRGFLHFPNNGGSGEGFTSMDPTGAIYTTTNSGTSMHTKVLVPASASTSDATVRRSSADTLTFNSDASAAHPVRHHHGGLTCVYTSPATITLSPASATGNAYLYIDSSCNLIVGHNGLTFAGSNGVTVEAGVSSFPTGSDPVLVWASTSAGSWTTSGYTKGGLENIGTNNHRFLVELGTETAADYLTLHDIHSDQTSSMAPATMLDSGDNWRTVEIGGSLPAVAAFSRNGQCYTSWSATTTYTGTAEVAIAGLCPGSYRVLKGGALQLTESVTGDRALYFSGTAGPYTVVQESAENPVTITTTSLPSGLTGTSYSEQLLAIGGVISYGWTLESGTLCAGLTLSSSGSISGTPTAAGPCDFTVRVTDQLLQTHVRSLSIAVTTPSSALVLITDDLPDGVNGAPYQATLQASGGTPPYIWSLSSGQLPAELTLHADTGVISGTASQIGGQNFRVNVTDSAAPPHSDSKDLSILINEPLSLEPLDLNTRISTPSRILVQYGRAGLDANQTCTLKIGTTNPVTNPLETSTDSGGVARRQYMFGQTATLQPSTSYWVHAVCGSASATVQASTAPPATQPRTIPLRVQPPPGAQSMAVDYGDGPGLGSSINVSCSPGCEATIPSSAPGIVFLRYTFKDAQGGTVGSSGVKIIPLFP